MVVAATGSRYRLWYLPAPGPPAAKLLKILHVLAVGFDAKNGWINPLPPLGSKRLHTGSYRTLLQRVLSSPQEPEKFILLLSPSSAWISLQLNLTIGGIHFTEYQTYIVHICKGKSGR